MYATLSQEAEGSVSLIEETGIQFIDYGFNLNEILHRIDSNNQEAPKADGAEAVGVNSFIKQDNLLYQVHQYRKDGKDVYGIEIKNKQMELVRGSGGIELGVKNSLAIFDGVWLPVPFVRESLNTRSGFENRPTNWARMRITALPEADNRGNTHRISFAFDTRVFSGANGVSLIASDLEQHANFQLATSDTALTDLYGEVPALVSDEPENDAEVNWFVRWIRQSYINYTEKTPSYEEESFSQRDSRAYIARAHFLNVLSLFWRPAQEVRSLREVYVPISDVKLIKGHDGEKLVDVSLVLDIGNSRTCGLLFERTRSSDTAFDAKVVELRDLTFPERVYQHAFDSRVEFSEANFGDERLSAASGNSQLFKWPTFIRVGDEACHLAATHCATDGITGLSSPKRYLWSEDASEHTWRLNGPDKRPASLRPLSSLITSAGYPRSGHQPPCVQPFYARSAICTQMIMEVLSHVLMQINSVAYRRTTPIGEQRRRLRDIVLTVPPGMPLIERSLLRKRVNEAVQLLWKVQDWSKREDHYGSYLEPQVSVDWDEATCAQLVYLQSEINTYFNQRSELFFDHILGKLYDVQPDLELVKPVASTPVEPSKDKTLNIQDDRNRETLGTLRLAVIDVGGGTSDLVINDFHLLKAAGMRSEEAHTGSTIVPYPQFRDSLKVAGDDILLDVIQKIVLPAFRDGLLKSQVGHEHIDRILRALCGHISSDVTKTAFRRQLTLQLFTPLALAILQAYEDFDVVAYEKNKGQEPSSTTSVFGDYLIFPNDSHEVAQRKVKEKRQRLSPVIINHIHQEIADVVGHTVNIDLANFSIDFQLPALHAEFRGNGMSICRSLAALCEVVSQYDCDVLLVTGRPSRLPGVKQYIQQQMALSPTRVISLNEYRPGEWYPFRGDHHIRDPKTTAAVGAMLCKMRQLGVRGVVNCAVGQFKPSSTLNYLGRINSNCDLPEQDVCIVMKRDKDTGRGNVFEGSQNSLIMEDSMHLGFRQLASSRWPATPLYTLDYSERYLELYDDAVARTVSARDAIVHKLKVEFELKQEGAEQNGNYDEHAPQLELGNELLEVSDVIAPSFIEGDHGPDFVKLQLNTMATGGLGDSGHWLDSGLVLNNE